MLSRRSTRGGGRSGRTCLVPQSLVRLCEGHRLLSQRVEQCQRNDFSGGLCEGPRDKSHAQRNVCGRNRSEREPTRAAVDAVFTKERLRALISTCVRQEQAARKQHETKCNEIAGNERKCAYFALLPGDSATLKGAVLNEEVVRMRLGDTKGSFFLGRSCNIKEGAALN